MISSVSFAICLYKAILRIFVQHIFVLLRPSFNRQLSNSQRRRIDLFDPPIGYVLARCVLFDSTSEALVPGFHVHHILAPEVRSDVCNDLSRVEVWNLAGPPCPNAKAAVDEHHWDHGAIPLGFHRLTILIQVLENPVVIGMEGKSCALCQPRVDVTGSGVILTAEHACAKLTRGDEQVQVVGPNEVLCKIDDRVLQRCLAMMICGLLGGVTHQLRHLHVRLEVSLETREENLPL
mmetsp:Transcript_37329/g.93762  ORF Transcript_37329/g.93762 Transcript_37329/m.93762 type:complete len:235 (-) Transcript_37329:2323-3027(-)